MTGTLTIGKLTKTASMPESEMKINEAIECSSDSMTPRGNRVHMSFRESMNNKTSAWLSNKMEVGRPPVNESDVEDIVADFGSLVVEMNDV